MPNEGHGHHALRKRTPDEKPRSRTHWKLANTKTGPSQSHSAAAGNEICALNFGIQVHALHLGWNVIASIDEQRLTVVAPACDPLPIADSREGAPPSTGYRTVRPFPFGRPAPSRRPPQRVPFRLAKGNSDCFGRGHSTTPGEVSAGELADARDLAERKYATAEWIDRIR